MSDSQLSRRVSRFVNSHRVKVRGVFDRASIPAAYYDVANFGDQLTPEVFKYMGLRALHCPNYKHAKVAGVGSILHMLPENFEGQVIGSGLISPEKILLPRAEFRLVRGQLTRDILGVKKEIPLGDPGIIVDQIYSLTEFHSRGSNPVGVIPHYVDEKEGWVERISSGDFGTSIRIINVRSPVSEVVQDILSCSVILSSSLHGLIVAESYGIPSRWIKLSDRLIGGDFKFHDYYSAYGVKRSPYMVDSHDSPFEIGESCEVIAGWKVAAVKHNVLEAMSGFVRSLGLHVRDEVAANIQSLKEQAQLRIQ